MATAKQIVKIVTDELAEVEEAKAHAEASQKRLVYENSTINERVIHYTAQEEVLNRILEQVEGLEK